MNEKLKEALFTGKYVCPECGKLMVFEEPGNVLVCENCGYDCRLDDYGLDEDEIAERDYEHIPAIDPYEEYEKYLIDHEDDD